MSRTLSSETAPSIPLIAIGDVHGRADLLERLIEKIEARFDGEPFKAIFLGDYVDRGEDSRGVIDQLIAFKDRHRQTVFLKGNHEQAMLDFLALGEDGEHWLGWGGEATLASYGVEARFPYHLDTLQEELAASLPDRHFTFLMNLKLRHDEGRYVFVHAGLDPNRHVDDQLEQDMLWIREAFFAHGEGCFGDRIIVHGHTPVKRPDNLAWRINVDTGAYWTSKLTAVVLEDGRRSFLTT
jgi:serine/threonine protein phosphatase 1